MLSPYQFFTTNLLEFSSCQENFEDGVCRQILESLNLENGNIKNLSTGSYLKKGLGNVQVFDNWSRKSLEEGVYSQCLRMYIGITS